MPHQLWLLITGTAHAQMSQWQMSIYTNTQYCALWGLGERTDDCALDTTQSPHKPPTTQH